MSKHTPVPWKHNGSKISEGASHNHPAVAVWARKDRTFVCQMFGSSGDIKPTVEEIEANCILITAAPEMLAACQGARKLFDQGMVEGATDADWVRAILDQIDDAIEKACGDAKGGCLTKGDLSDGQTT